MKLKDFKVEANTPLYPFSFNLNIGYSKLFSSSDQGKYFVLSLDLTVFLITLCVFFFVVFF